MEKKRPWHLIIPTSVAGILFMVVVAWILFSIILGGRVGQKETSKTKAAQLKELKTETNRLVGMLVEANIRADQAKNQASIAQEERDKTAKENERLNEALEKARIAVAQAKKAQDTSNAVLQGEIKLLRDQTNVLAVAAASALQKAKSVQIELDRANATIGDLTRGGVTTQALIKALQDETNRLSQDLAAKDKKVNDNATLINALRTTNETLTSNFRNAQSTISDLNKRLEKRLVNNISYKLLSESRDKGINLTAWSTNNYGPGDDSYDLNVVFKCAPDTRNENVRSLCTAEVNIESVEWKRMRDGKTKKNVPLTPPKVIPTHEFILSPGAKITHTVKIQDPAISDALEKDKGQRDFDVVHINYTVNAYQILPDEPDEKKSIAKFNGYIIIGVK